MYRLGSNYSLHPVNHLGTRVSRVRFLPTTRRRDLRRGSYHRGCEGVGLRGPVGSVESRRRGWVGETPVVWVVWGGDGRSPPTPFDSSEKTMEGRRGFSWVHVPSVEDCRREVG